MSFINYTGQKIGKLNVVKRAPDKISGGRKRTMWFCRCDCGNQDDVIVSADYLKRSKCPSCGCEVTKNKIKYNRVDNIGQKFGRLTIIDVLWDYDRSKAVCKCDCGNIYVGVKSDIVCGHTKSCGCLQSENTSFANTKDWTGYVSNYGIEFICQDHMNNKGQWLWKCRCGVCGNYFIALPAKVNNGHITSCGCRIKSSNEEYIEYLLSEMCVDFKSQYAFNDCKDIYKLRFDFAILDHDSVLGLIEYDGKQHFEPIDFFGGEDGFKATQKRDKIKDNYCRSHNIPLLRLSYTLSIDEIKTKIYEYYLSLTTAVGMVATS